MAQATLKLTRPMKLNMGDSTNQSSLQTNLTNPGETAVVTSFLPITPAKTATTAAFNNSPSQPSVPMRTFGNHKRMAPPVPPKKRPVSMATVGGHGNLVSGIGYHVNTNPESQSPTVLTNGAVSSSQSSGASPRRSFETKQMVIGASPRQEFETKQKVIGASHNQGFETRQRGIGGSTGVDTCTPRRQSQPANSSVTYHSSSKSSQGVTVPGVSSPSPRELKHVSKRHSVPANMGMVAAGNSLPIGYGGWSPTKQPAVPVQESRENAEEERREVSDHLSLFFFFLHIGNI